MYIEKSLIEIRDMIRTGKVKSEEVTKECLSQIEAKKDLNAIVEISQNAITQAKEIDKQIKAGKELGTLAGVPIVVKDNMNTLDMKTTCCSAFLKNFVAPFEATVVSNLKKEGAIIIGKANMDEFAMGSSNENSYRGAVKNPHDASRVPGGSSGGSACSVAANECFGALGSDTGGSIRQPSSLCGVVGLKPTYGSVSRYGIVAFASSLDQAGPITRTVADNALLFDAIASIDEHDATNIVPQKKHYPNSVGKKSIKGMRIGIAKEYFSLPMADDVKEAVQKVIDFYRSEGAEIVDISLPHIDSALSVYYVISSAEAASNLARFDGIKYTERMKGKDIVDIYFKSRTAGFGQEVKRRIMLGNFVLSAGFYDAYYKKATQVQQMLKDEFAKAFTKCDVIISPTATSEAFKLNANLTPLEMYMNDVFTVPVNIVGRPAISFPCSKGKNGLPLGVQLIADNAREDNLFALADYYERNVGGKK